MRIKLFFLSRTSFEFPAQDCGSVGGIEAGSLYGTQRTVGGPGALRQLANDRSLSFAMPFALPSFKASDALVLLRLICLHVSLLASNTATITGDMEFSPACKS